MSCLVAISLYSRAIFFGTLHSVNSPALHDAVDRHNAYHCFQYSRYEAVEDTRLCSSGRIREGEEGVAAQLSHEYGAFIKIPATWPPYTQTGKC